MDNMRNMPIEKIGEFKVLTFKDIQNNIQKNIETGEITKVNMPKSNVLYYELEDDNWCCVRPSGTEPKIKLYIGVKGVSEEDATRKLEELKEATSEMMK